MLNRHEIRQSLNAVENAVAQQRLEGLEPSKELVADLQRVAQGEITISEVIGNIGKRFGGHGQVFQSGQVS